MFHLWHLTNGLLRGQRCFSYHLQGGNELQLGLKLITQVQGRGRLRRTHFSQTWGFQEQEQDEHLQGTCKGEVVSIPTTSEMCLGGCEFQSSTVLIRTETAGKKKKFSRTLISSGDEHPSLGLIQDPRALQPFIYKMPTMQQDQTLGSRVSPAPMRSASRMSGLCPPTGQLRETASGRETGCRVCPSG